MIFNYLHVRISHSNIALVLREGTFFLTKQTYRD